MGMVCPGLMVIYGTLERQRHCTSTNNGFGMETIRMDGARSLIHSFIYMYVCMYCMVCMYVCTVYGRKSWRRGTGTGGRAGREEGKGREGKGREGKFQLLEVEVAVLTYYIVLYRTVS